jgi:hypothetical protein
LLLGLIRARFPHPLFRLAVYQESQDASHIRLLFLFSLCSPESGKTSNERKPRTAGIEILAIKPADLDSFFFFTHKGDDDKTRAALSAQLRMSPHHHNTTPTGVLTK